MCIQNKLVAMETCGEAVRADVIAGSRRKSKSVIEKNKPSLLANLLATVSPALMVSSSSATLPTTSTWYPVSKRRATDATDATQSKAASKKRKRLGQVKMKRDRIMQEIGESRETNRNLQSTLTAANKRISQLQGAQARLPTAKEVCKSRN